MHFQADIQYWDDTLSEEIQAVEKMIKKISKLSGMERQAAIERCQARLRGASGTKRSFKMECRLVQDVAFRKQYEARLQQLDKKLKALQADVKALEAEGNRGELFVGADEGNGFDSNGMDGVKAGDAMLNDMNGIQDKTKDSLARTKTMVAESKEVGIATLEELERQREVIGNIDKEVDRIDDSLARAEALLKQFGKRMASDSFIQCFALINCLLLVGVIIFAILRDQGDENTPVSPTGGNRRLFLRRED